MNSVHLSAPSLDRGETTFRAAAFFALVIAPLLMLAAAFELSREFSRAQELRAAVNRSYEARSQIQSVFSTLQDAETGQRGYVLTQNSSFLDPYRSALARLADRTARLERLLQDKPDQLRRLRELERLYGLKLEEISEVLAAMEAQDTAAARSSVAEGRGKALMDQIRLIVDEMIAAEATGLETRVREEQRLAHNAERAVVALFVLMAGAIISAAILVMRHFLSRRALLAQMREVAARQQAVLDSATDGILTLNRSGSVESINRAGQRMFGWSLEDLLRRDLSTLIVLEDGREGAFVSRLLGPDESLQGGVNREMTGRRRDGSTFPVEVALSEMELPGENRIVAMIRDISERQRVTRLKEEFVSTVSHELRTPLTSIAGSLGLVTGGAAGEISDRARRLVTIAQTNCQRLVRLINDILDIEKMESGKVRFELKPTPLPEIAARSVEEVRGFADGFGVRLDLKTDGTVPLVRADADRLVQVATNLLSNAAKFSPPGGEVEVTVGAVDGSARLSVRDRGPGIPEGFKDRIFGKFAQADGSDTRQKGGTGLGLAIAREIVERHGGKLWFETPPDGGAVFHMDLPKVGELTAGLEPGVRLLICEDEVVTAAALREALEDEGFIVDITETLADAEQALRRADYACLVTDLKLPDGDGLSLIRRMRSGPESRRVPVIVVSGDAAQRREQSRALALDVVAWIGKPVDPARLKDAILAALETEGGRPLILHVDDDRDMLQITAAALASCGDVISVESLADARQKLAERRPDIVVLDLGLADGSGLDLLPDTKGKGIPVVVFTAQESQPGLAGQVDSVLTKSRTSLSSLARTVRRLTRPAARDQAHERQREAVG